MSDVIRVYKNRTTTIIHDFGEDVSNDIITSEIRSQPNLSGAYIASWVVSFVTDGTDGKVQLVLDDSLASNIQAAGGFTDICREIDAGGTPGTGTPIPVFDEPVEVVFVGVVSE